MYRFIILIVAGALLLIGPGCESLDPADDLAAANALIRDRLGFEVDWFDLGKPSPEPSRLTLEEATRLAVTRHPLIRLP